MATITSPLRLDESLVDLNTFVPRQLFRLGDKLRAGYMANSGEQMFRQERSTPEYAVVYLLAGEGWYEDDSCRIPLRPGDLMQRVPNHPHAHVLEAGSVAINCYLAVPAEIFESLCVTSAQTAHSPVLHVGLHQTILDRFHGFAHELLTQAEHRLNETIARAHMFLAELHNRQTDADRDWQDTIERACSILAARVGDRATIPDIAREVGMPYSTFRKRFTQMTGLSPNQYLIQRRVEYSKELLCRPDISVSQAAEIAGYPDVYTFSKQFKRLTGIPPLQFKKTAMPG